MLPVYGLTNNVCSQCRTFQGYKLLIQNIPNLEEKLLKMEVDELVVYFREVSCHRSSAHF